LENLKYANGGNSFGKSLSSSASVAYITNKASINSDNKDKKEIGLVLQPIMRFKPRTDLERVYEEINKNSFGTANKNIVERQLKELDLNVAKTNDKNIKDGNLDFDIIGSQEMNKNNYETTIKEELKKEEQEKLKKANKYKRKLDLNYEAKNLMKDLHNKTYFKGATVIANHIEPLIQNHNYKVNKIHLSEKERQDKIFRSILDQSSTENLYDINNTPLKTNRSNKSIQGKIFIKLILDEINHANEFKINFNPIKNISSDSRNLNLNALKLIHSIAHSKPSNSIDSTDRKIKKVNFINKLKKSFKANDMNNVNLNTGSGSGVTSRPATGSGSTNKLIHIKMDSKLEQPTIKKGN
jgi:hypothetical protein